MTEHVLPDGTHAILSPWQGIDLATGDDVGWHADPGTAQNRWARLTATDHGMVVAGDFAFMRGLPMAGVGALRADLSPDPAFRSPLDTDENRSNVETLALNDGWLLVGGDAWLPASDGDQGTARCWASTRGRATSRGIPATRPRRRSGPSRSTP